MTNNTERKNATYLDAITWHSFVNSKHIILLMFLIGIGWKTIQTQKNMLPNQSTLQKAF